eukprot:gene14863-biopygen5149
MLCRCFECALDALWRESFARAEPKRWGFQSVPRCFDVQATAKHRQRTPNDLSKLCNALVIFLGLLRCLKRARETPLRPPHASPPSTVDVAHPPLSSPVRLRDEQRRRPMERQDLEGAGMGGGVTPIPDCVFLEIAKKSGDPGIMQIPDICGYEAPQAPYKGTNKDDAAPQAPPRETVKHSAAPQAPLKKEEEEMQLQAPQKHNNAEQILAADVPVFSWDL